MVVLITGRPNSGKTTFAYEFKEYMSSVLSDIIILDGDELREALGYKSYTREGRTKWMLCIAKMARVFEKQGLDVIICLVSPLKDVRRQMLKMFEKSVLLYIKGKEECMWEETADNCSIYEEPDEDGDGADYYITKKGYDDER